MIERKKIRLIMQSPFLSIFLSLLSLMMVLLFVAPLYLHQQTEE